VRPVFFPIKEWKGRPEVSLIEIRKNQSATGLFVKDTGTGYPHSEKVMVLACTNRLNRRLINLLMDSAAIPLRGQMAGV